MLEGLKELREEILKDLEEGLYHGANYAVCRGDEILVHESLGYAHKASGREGQLNDIYLGFSLAKAFTTLAILQMVDRGLVSLTTKVGEVIPEFATKGKEEATLWNLLTHTAGVSVYPTVLPMEEMGDLDLLIPVICDLPAEYLPGEKVSYSTGSNHTLIGEMVRRLDPGKRTFRDYIKEEICLPLGMKDTGFGKPQDEKRVVPVVYAERSGHLIDPDVIEHYAQVMKPESEFPGGGVYTTVSDLIQLTSMLSKKGAYPGGRILEEETFLKAVTNQTGEMCDDFFAEIRRSVSAPESPAYMGLSFFLRGKREHPSNLGQHSSPETFGSTGLGSSLFWVDPVRNLRFVFLSAGLLGDATNFKRFQKLSSLVGRV